MSGYNVIPIIKLTEHFEKLPGISKKSARRLAYSILNMSQSQAEDFANCILNVKSSIHPCKICCDFTDKEICSICSDPKRDKSVICVVEESKDIGSFERTGDYNGLYHILHGVISPLNGIGPDDIRINELLKRVSDKNNNIKEVILALNPNVEGEATLLYISKLLKPFGVAITRIAYGIPIGSTLEYTDEVTLLRALQGRSKL